MRRFVLKIALFFLLICGVDMFAGVLFSYLRKNAKGGGEKAFSELFEKENHEILVLGSSRALHHYVPDVIVKKTGLECYNGGYDGNGVILAYPVIMNILKRQKPRLLIYEVSMGFDVIENAEDENNMRYIANLKPYYKKEIVNDVISSVSKTEIIKLNSSLYRHNSSLIPLVIDNFRNRGGRNDGYAPLSGTLKTIHKIGAKKGTYSLDRLKLFYLQELASLHQIKNLAMVWVVSPQFYVDYDDSIYEVAKRIASEYDVPFLNYTKDSRFVGHVELFQDPTHLNDTGARLYSDIFVDDMMDFMTLKN